ncbi:LysM peptidoglycan-binding domain-containing protein [Pullulanibacillus sp. KACC 23026]|uniref:C40 family peptidase n=1 Tax=Pullulanibacillus sp. KACC 23026 TaxID=3028315 RepID=UPI0023B06D05|nr:LysM peptidoglycan-binding domain-containing protein [Pullulanibacillus sp. KACC 23026]WEG12460.1 LysM peptidoglycan-binding domain-containing protein [Pullulanibacillus sp. KACC 23026]
MDILNYKLSLLHPDRDEYELVINLDGYTMEFAEELGTLSEKRNNLVDTAKQIINERFPKVKVTMIKVLVGGMAITSIPLLGSAPLKAKAAESTSSTPIKSETNQKTETNKNSDSIYYNVSAGDTLWIIAGKFNTTIDNIKQANHLTSDSLQINQQLIIPMAFHIVGTGDYLTVLAKEYNISVDAIKEANGLTSDSTYLGQTLIIPQMIGDQQTPAAPSVTSSSTQNTTYKVVSGDSLSVIAKRYNVTVDAIKQANQLTSDTIQVGQTLTIPTNGGTVPTAASASTTTTASTQSYTVVSGDSLSVIAKRYNVTVDAIKQANQLTSDTIQVGQTLTIPASGGTVSAASSASTTTAASTQSYTVASGDSLSVIAKRYNVTVDAIKQANQLTSDTIQVGQTLTIPGGQASTVNSTAATDSNLKGIQQSLETLGYYTVTTMTGTYDSPTQQAIRNFQSDYGLPVTGTADQATQTAISHAVVKKSLISDTQNYIGVPYLWGGTSPKGFDCSGFVYYMFNQQGVTMSRNTSAGLYTQGQTIDRAKLEPGDLVFFAVNTPGTISHVGFYIGNNEFISATSSKGIAVYSMDNSYWKSYYVGAKRIY